MVPFWEHLSFFPCSQEKRSQNGSVGLGVRIAGQAEIQAFLISSPQHGDSIRAWTFEVKHRRWDSASELAIDFLNVDVSRVPVVVFYLAPAAIRIETLIYFRLGVVLITAIHPPTTSSDRYSPTWSGLYAH